MKRAPVVVALLLLVVAAIGCGRLGNPPSPQGRTVPAAWTDGQGVQIVTEAEYDLAEHAARVLSRYAPGAFQHLDAHVPRGGVVAVVGVTIDFPGPFAPPYLPLRTRFTFHDGTTLTRAWPARANARVVRAVFGLPQPPESAVTDLEG
jgi:hypothetical protein